MALSITVSKKSVTKDQNGQYAITLNMVAKEGLAEVINKDFTSHYHNGVDPAAIIAKWQIDMQAEIAKYKDEQSIYTHATLDAGVTTLNTNLVG
jgi:hypothetical protein